MHIQELGEVGSDRDARPRAFDTDASPPKAPHPGEPGSTPEERAQLHEQASAGHHNLVRAVVVRLRGSGWERIEEILGGLDLWATKDGQRIFEAKTLRDANAAHQVRIAIAQLLEYRFTYGESNDGLCLVTDAPVSEQRVRLLESLGMGLLVRRVDKIRAAGSVTLALDASAG